MFSEAVFETSKEKLIPQSPVVEPLGFRIRGDEVTGRVHVTIGTRSETQDIYVNIPDRILQKKDPQEAIISLSDLVYIGRPDDRDQMYDMYFAFFRRAVSEVVATRLYVDFQR